MTAFDLLYKVLDYSYLWETNDRIDSKPSRCRLQQIEKLFVGFKISKANPNPYLKGLYSIFGLNKPLTRAEYLATQTNLDYFTSGEFIIDRPKDYYSHVSLKIASTLKTIHPDWADFIDQKPVDLKWLFSNLLQFRQEVFKVASPHGGMLEGFSAGLEYSFYLQRRFKETMLANVTEIDETLCLLIDPESRSIAKEEIGYPDFDLKTIDLDWRMENY